MTPLIDGLFCVAKNLRVSVSDRCALRRLYCTDSLEGIHIITCFLCPGYQCNRQP